MLQIVLGSAEVAKVHKMSMQGSELENVRHDFGSVQKLQKSALERYTNQKKRPSRCGEKCPGIRVQLGESCSKSLTKSVRVVQMGRSYIRWKRLLQSY